jgi:hypothetical protein
VNGRRLDVHAIRIGFAHSRVDFEHRNTVAVDRHFDQFALDDAAKQLPGGDRVELHAEGVVAVGRERVHDGNPATRPERRALDVLHLRSGARNFDGRFRRAGLWIPDRQSTDPARSPQIPVHQGRGESLHVGHVVEPAADGVGRQKRGHIHIQVQQIADGARVLRAIQALKRPASRIRVQRRRKIQPRFHGGGKGRDRRNIRATRADGGHHAQAQLADHFLGGLGNLRILADPGGVEAGQREIAGALFPTIVVTANAVLLHESRLRVGDGGRGVRDGDGRFGGWSAHASRRRLRLRFSRMNHKAEDAHDQAEAW